MRHRAYAAMALVVLATACARTTVSGPLDSLFHSKSATAKPAPSGSSTPSPLVTTQPLSSPPPPIPTAPTGADPVVAVVKQVEPAVVNVTTNLFTTTPFGTEPGRGVGTGFIIRSDGVIVTNFHVVERASHITVTTSVPPIHSYTAHVIGGDQNADLAILKVGAEGLSTVPLGESSKLELGQRLVAMGYALALNGGPTVTSGIVSALDRTVRAADPNFPKGARTYTHVVQTDAAINPGNSGGPLLNLAGQVVGINTAGAQQAENIGFAISVDSAKSTIQGAITNPHGAVAFLGVETQDVTPQLVALGNLPVDHGAYVLGLAPKGPAEQAGIKKGDVIVQFDGQTVDSSQGMGTLIHKHRPGDTVQVGVVHPDGSRATYTATLITNPLPIG